MRPRAAGALLLAADGKPPNADASVLQDGHAPAGKLLCKGRQIGQQQRGLPIRPPVPHLPDQDQGRPGLGAQRQQCRKIGIGRNGDAILAPRPIENRLVRRGVIA